MQYDLGFEVKTCSSEIGRPRVRAKDEAGPAFKSSGSGGSP